MGFVASTRVCIHCHLRYHYNIDTGDFGWRCPYCGKEQLSGSVKLKLPKLKGMKEPSDKDDR